MRPKEFNRNHVLEKCVTLYWKHGFSSCSVKDIVTEARINRFSLYREFENKEGILYAAMDLYMDRYSSKRIRYLGTENADLSVIREFFFSFFEIVDDRPIGCFIIFIASELADTNPEIKERLDLYLQSIEMAIRNLLIQNQFSTEETEYLAKHLVGLFCNSMCYCVIQSSEERESYVNESLELILTKEKDYGKDT